MNRVTGIILTMAAMASFPAKSIGDSTVVEDFKDLMGGYSYVQTLENYLDVGIPEWYNLEWKNPETGAIECVPKVGFWRLAAIKYFGADAYVVGYANTDNSFTNYPGWEGFLLGDYTDLLGDGGRPDEVWIVWDQNGDGIGFYISGYWILGPDDKFYGTDKILFNSIRGDVSQMPPYAGGMEEAVLPQMVICSLPEPNFVVGDGVQVSEEGETTDSYSVVLSEVPMGNVSVTPVNSSGDVTVFPEVLEFDASNWSVPQEVTVTAVDDSELEGTPFESVVIDHIFSGSSMEVLNGSDAVKVTVLVDDNECGSWGYSPMDFNKDCRVDLVDFAMFASEWMNCTEPYQAGCSSRN